MIALYLLAAHLVGDFLLQTRWQAMGKFGWTEEAIWLRAKHAAIYSWCFIPVAAWYAGPAWKAAAFVAFLYAIHYFTDAQRFPNNLAETIVWRFMPQKDRAEQWQIHQALLIFPHQLRKPPPNPWPPMSLAIDQTLHVVQITVLAGLFL